MDSNKLAPIIKVCHKPINPLTPNVAIWQHTYFRHHNFLLKVLLFKTPSSLEQSKLSLIHSTFLYPQLYHTYKILFWSHFIARTLLTVSDAMLISTSPVCALSVFTPSLTLLILLQQFNIILLGCLIIARLSLSTKFIYHFIRHHYFLCAVESEIIITFFLKAIVPSSYLIPNFSQSRNVIACSIIII